MRLIRKLWRALCGFWRLKQPDTPRTAANRLFDPARGWQVQSGKLPMLFGWTWTLVEFHALVSPTGQWFPIQRRMKDDERVEFPEVN